MNRDTLQRILDTLIRASSYYDTYDAIAELEAELAKPEPIRREQKLFMDEQEFYAAGHQAMRPAELAERLKQGEKWAVAAQPQQEPVAWVGLDIDGMAEAFHRVIEEHHARTNPFHDPVNMYAMIALRELRGLIAYMKRNTSPPVQRQPLTDEVHNAFLQGIRYAANKYEVVSDEIFTGGAVSNFLLMEAEELDSSDITRAIGTSNGIKERS